MDPDSPNEAGEWSHGAFLAGQDDAPLQTLLFSVVLPQQHLKPFLPANLNPNLSTVPRCAILIDFTMQGTWEGESRAGASSRVYALLVSLQVTFRGINVQVSL